MKLKTNIYRIALLSSMLAMAGCSNSLLVPIEDRTATPPRAEQGTRPTNPVINDTAVAIPLPEDMQMNNRSPQAATTEPLSPAPDIDATSIPISPSSIEPVQKNTAVTALLNEADGYSQQGNLRSAQTSLQRAQRIAPRDPEVYYALANTHLSLQDYSLAEQVALKGVSIAQGQPNQLRRFWGLIAVIRTAAGDANGANQARDTANRY